MRWNTTPSNKVELPMTNALTKTTTQKHIAIIRIIAGAPLLMFGIMHLSGAMPMKPLIEAAGLPMPGITAIVASLAQVFAGIILLFGAFARVGAAIAIGTMIGALITHIKIPNDQWPTPSELDINVMVPGPEPTFMMGLAAGIILTSAYIIFKGAGPWSVDSKLLPHAPNQSQDQS